MTYECTCGAERLRTEHGYHTRCECEDVVFEGYTRRELTVAFNEVADRVDWKAPIYNCAVLCCQRKVTAAAVEFFTATTATFRSHGSDVLLWVEADGYRHGPAGDH